jgi:hypothetical protein
MILMIGLSKLRSYEIVSFLKTKTNEVFEWGSNTLLE